MSGMKYKDISEKYNVPINTIKSWKRRYSWQREGTPNREKVVPRKKRVQVKEETSKLRGIIQNDLRNQLKVNNTSGAQYTDLVNDYMSMWDIKNHLIADIEERGVVVEWLNGKQQGKKKNESIGELNKKMFKC